jgi:peptide/nickel transport system permease protein
MIGYLIRRLAQTLVVLFFVTVLTLFLVHLFPGGPIKAMLGPRATVAQVAYYNRLYGFDQPFYLQYVKWIGQLLHGNLGFSSKLNQSVASLIAQDLPKTMVLVALGTIVSLVFGVPLGMYQAVKRYTVGDYALTAISFLGYATPTFFVGLLLVEWFSVDTHLFPPFAPQSSSVLGVLEQPRAWSCRSPRTRSCCTRCGAGTCARR